MTHDHRAASGEIQRPLQEQAKWSLGWTQTNSADILTKNQGMGRPLHTKMSNIAGGITFRVGCCRTRLQAEAKCAPAGHHWPELVRMSDPSHPSTRQRLTLSFQTDAMTNSITPQNFRKEGPRPLVRRNSHLTQHTSTRLTMSVEGPTRAARTQSLVCTREELLRSP